MSFVSMKITGFGRIGIFDDGKFIGSIGASPFANMTDIRNEAGAFIGQDRIDGFGSTQHFDENMMPTGFSRPNPSGGFDSYSNNGFLSHTTNTEFGMNVHNSEGGVDSMVGDIDAGDDIVNSFMNHF